eukprot:CAMPEP_0198207958 /NCGR_PEP_ID=MMETSP1445-20131203/11371_1 /TAXON_ID=36898 /ORGANISM="Pyramimonas sp., Strain CCMP2087" /LENGTH=334 /DNA_ID=CAMNT_0043881175 /DNA_START=175 /DNA_END=1175 /DNA_ORIENTATION=-
MTSVLAQQLKAISVGRPDKLKKGKASLLYDPQEAADVDVETIYNLALGGFDELCELDGRFQAFSKTLFGRAGLDVNRDLEGKETNDKFDASIKSFLRLLTGNFLLPCAFRALEYLVRRYKIHEYNAEAFLCAVLPYHSTNEFVRVVQIIQVSKLPMWEFLAGVRETGAAPPRSLLVARCMHYAPFLQHVCSYAQTASRESKACKTTTSFYTVLLIELVAAVPKVTDALVAQILPFVLTGLSKKASVEFQAGSFMIAGQLMSRVVLDEKVLADVLTALTKGVHLSLQGHALQLLLVAARTQRMAEMPKLAGAHIMQWADLPGALTELAGLADLSG